MKQRYAEALSLLGLDAQGVSTDEQFAETLAQSEFSLEPSWKQSTEDLVDVLCNRFSPECYIDFDRNDDELVVTRSDVDPPRSRTVSMTVDPDQSTLVATVAELADRRAWLLRVFADGDDLSFLLLPIGLSDALEKVLGTDFGRHFEACRSA